MSIHSRQHDTRTAFNYKGYRIEPHTASGPVNYLMDWPDLMKFRRRYWVIVDGIPRGTRVATKTDARRYIDDLLI